MSEQNDKRLHDWVRQSLAAHQPAYIPADWERLKRQRQRRRRWRGALWISVGIVLIGMLGWLWRQTRTGRRVPSALTTVQPTELPPTESPEPRPTIRPKTPAPTAAVSRVSRSRAAVLPSPQVDPFLLRYPTESIPALRIPTALPTALTERIHQGQPVAISPEETAIIRQVKTGDFGSDSTAYRVLDRNLRQWPAAVIVCDMTTSMYPYTTQLLTWFRKNTAAIAPQGFVFFTDCDSLGQQTRPGGLPGRMYVSRDVRPANTLPLLLEAARNTVNNKDDAENTVEALIRAQTEFPQARHLILVADNLSQVKDMPLLNRLTKPVHVVLCGTTGSDTARAYQPDYYQLAEQTHGSIHTLEDDLNPATVSPTQTVRVGTRYYRYSPRRKQFKLTPYDHRPRRFLKFVWL
ncbi:hypothetical protein [Spirosoma radiotolerans]|uniref:Uncharacterized protein n=1 Tax=Spirosoma radiotolerans TaxID=1379870 RepID=A0A0E3V788_9BACT|nr:hypothetical protein [Spirosoma radiotolerans]AKD55687.1 hypothetical protein SD10_13040 [Spirosoma radiotolerans]